MSYIYTEEDLIKLIKKCDHGHDFLEDSKSDKLSLMELEWNETLTKLSNARLRLTNEEEAFIKKIANKY